MTIKEQVINDLIREIRVLLIEDEKIPVPSAKKINDDLTIILKLLEQGDEPNGSTYG
jgi:hypothetical protein